LCIFTYQILHMSYIFPVGDCPNLNHLFYPQIATFPYFSFGNNLFMLKWTDVCHIFQECILIINYSVPLTSCTIWYFRIFIGGHPAICVICSTGITCRLQKSLMSFHICRCCFDEWSCSWFSVLYKLNYLMCLTILLTQYKA